MHVSTSTKAALVSFAVGAVLAGFVIGYKSTQQRSPAPMAAPSVTLQPLRAPVAAPLPLAPVAVDLQTSFQQLAATLPADVGIAVSAGNQSTTYGTWRNGAAWSTIKVPLSIAALRRDSIAAEPLVTQAITQSDNNAADQLWSMLGAPEAAGAAVQTVLAEGTDAGVTVQTKQVRPPYSPYGQTEWSLQDAADFTFQLPCLAADSVLAEMRSIAPEQQWGLAGESEVAAKGGWGPEPDGGYLVRQIALVGSGSSSFGVAIAAKPYDGSFSTGTAMLNQVSQWILDHRQQMPTGNCGANRAGSVGQP